jgi:hypothetical protein
MITRHRNRPYKHLAEFYDVIIAPDAFSAIQEAARQACHRIDSAPSAVSMRPCVWIGYNSGASGEVRDQHFCSRQLSKNVSPRS